MSRVRELRLEPWEVPQSRLRSSSRLAVRLAGAGSFGPLSIAPAAVIDEPTPEIAAVQTSKEQYNMSTHKRLVSLVVLGGVAAASGAGPSNMILNGSFENNTAGGTLYNLVNADFSAIMANATALGTSQELDIMHTSNFFGLAPVDGDYKVALHYRADGGVDAFSFDLSNSIVAGRQYTVSFWAQTVMDFDPGREPLLIGISNSATDFGTQVFSTGPISPSSWQYFEHTFIAGSDAAYLTVANGTGPNPTWIHVDDFRLVPAPGSVGVLALGGLVAMRRRR